MKIRIRALLALTAVLLLVISVLPANAAQSTRYVILKNGTIVPTTTTYTGTATSFTGRSDNFSVGYFVYNGQLVAAHSLLGKTDASVSNLDLNLKAVGPGFNPVIAKGAGTDLNVTGSLSAYDNSDGTHASDFTGLGTQIIASDGAKVNVKGMNIYTNGFLHDAFIADNHAELTVTNSNITTMGANPLTQAWNGYQNSAIQSEMLSPPWVLGIQGGVRASNELGNGPTFSVIDSNVTSGGWALLSTDSGSNEKMNVVDSNLTMLPASQGGMSAGPYSYADQYGSGYGSYLIGNATQDFYGVNIKGTTYGDIVTGGTASYMSSKGTITLKNADDHDITTVNGKGHVSKINSVWGFMTHGNGAINVLDGTVVNSQEATFLYKYGNVTFNADHAFLHSNSGILLQMVDNPDNIIHAKMGKGGPIFSNTFSETPGWPSESGSVTQTALNNDATIQTPVGTTTGPNYCKVQLDLKNGHYTGNVYNGTGYYGQVGDVLHVNIGTGGSLNGAIALTETKHVDQNGNGNPSFNINQYYYFGHVANKLYNNGNSKITVDLSNGGVWKVTGKSEITKLIVGNGNVTAGSVAAVYMTVNGVPTQIQQGHTYTGTIVITPRPI